MKILLLYRNTLSNNQLNILYRNLLLDSQYTDKQFINGLEAFDFTEVKPINSADTKETTQDRKEWLQFAKSSLDNYDVIFVANAELFKLITKKPKAEAYLGELFDSPYTTAKVMYVPPQHSYGYDVSKHKASVIKTIKRLHLWHSGAYTQYGTNIIHSAKYPATPHEINQVLNELLNEPILFCDIEAHSLNVTQAGLGSIAFSVGKHRGCAFPVDLRYAEQNLIKVKKYLKTFFEAYQGKLVFHKANYDVPVLIYELFMEQDITNTKQLLYGLDCFFKNIQDTLIIAYLATNSCAGNKLGLKELASDFAGDWAVDVKDITKVPTQELLEYNLVDCFSTAYVYMKYYPLMVQDEQEDLYYNFMLPTLKTNIRCQLQGLPIDLNKVKELKDKLIAEQSLLTNALYNSPEVVDTAILLAEKASKKYNRTHKVKRRTVEECMTPLNFNSDPQLRLLLYKRLNLPVIETTDSGLPATNKKTLKLLESHTDNPQHLSILEWLTNLKDVGKILTGFIPAFESAHVDKYGNAHLLGYFNISGTLCHTEDTLIHTNKGVKTYKDIAIGDLVLTHTGTYEPVCDKFSSGLSKVLEITTESGLSIKVTPDHPFYVNGNWVNASDLLEGDLVTTKELKERWKTIEDWENYQISSWGRVRNKKTKRILKPAVKNRGRSKKSYGHLKISLARVLPNCPKSSRKHSTKKDFEIHRLVAEAFLPNPLNKPEVAHINGIPSDNSILNLKWATSKENSKDSLLHGTTRNQLSKLTDEQVLLIRANPNNLNNTELAKKFNVSRELCRDIRLNKKRTNLTPKNITKKVKFLNSRIVSIKELELQEVFSLTVKTAHSHVTNGFVTHNSGRLSSSNINLQNLPATGSRFAKPVKNCFRAPKGWVFIAQDFASLEDRISALTTKDKNKLKVYTDHYDGHSLRAYTYFSEQMPDIDPNSVESINSIADKYPELRQRSKNPTFLTTYGGGVHGLMKNCGFSQKEAQSIFDKYHELYKESDVWVQSHIKKACDVGYVTTGFGLRVRTPVLEHTVYSDNMGSLASAEARTAGNALGQGWGVLNDRLMNATLEQLAALGLQEDVLPIAKIHDAVYFLARNDVSVITTLNQILSLEAKWQEHPLIQHPDVGLSGEMDICYPSWGNPITIPNNCSEDDLVKIVQTHQQKH